MTARRLHSAWPLGCVIVSFLIGFAVDGPGGAVLAAALATLVFGPAYLLRNYLRSRRAPIVESQPPSSGEKARIEARYLRIAAAAEIALGGAALAAAATGTDIWPSGKGWTALLVMAAAISVRSSPYLWALADWIADGRTNRWAWALTGGLDIAFAGTATALAATNHATHWLGGSAWTAGLCGLAALLVFGAPPEIRRALA
jgi:hypothetical protein